MSLTWPIVLCVLFGALLHASWNALIKSGSDKSLDTALLQSMGVVVAAPIVLIVGLPPAGAWPWLAASMLIHIGYYTALAGAYKHGDLGFSYPIMRGLAPLLVAVGSGPLIGETLPAATWLGVAGISAGVLLVGLSRGAGMAQARALRFALANAALVGLYTIVDGRGVRASGNALQYVGAFFLTNGLPYFLIVMWRRGSRRPAAWAYMRARWKLAFVGTAAALLSYGIALWAMTRAPVAAVAALRETSVLFAAVIGTRWLAEGFGWQRAAGTVLIVAGVVVLRLV